MSSASLSPTHVHDSLGDEMWHTRADHRHPPRPQISKPHHCRDIMALGPIARTSSLETWRFYRTLGLSGVALSSAQGNTHYPLEYPPRPVIRSLVVVESFPIVATAASRSAS
jgi:hypothetical protein